MEHGLLRAGDRSRAGGSATSRRGLLLGGSILAGSAAGCVARLLDVYGPRPLSAIGGGLALWLTLAFVVAQRGRTPAWAVAATALFLAFWLLGFYVTDAAQMGVPLRTMWPVARRWVLLLAPTSLVVGAAASRSTRRGRLGDAALALPLVWSVAEGLLALHREGAAAGIVVLAILLGTALAVVLAERLRRPVRLGVVLGSAAVAVVPFGLVALLIVTATR